MSDHPSQSPDAQAATPGEEAGTDTPSSRPDHRPADEKSVPERAEDEAAALGDFA